MEIDFRNIRKDGMIFSAAALLILLGLMLLGRAYTPDSGGLLTWQEWQVRQLRQAYQTERLRLLEDVNRLAELLAAAPDPARAQVVVQSVRRNLQAGRVEALADERARVADAAQAVLDWAAGIGDYNAAVDAVNSALEALEQRG